MRLHFLLPLALLAGCAASPSSSRTEDQLREDVLLKADGGQDARALARELPASSRKDARFEPTTEAAHRARHFYMLGLRLLQQNRVDEAIREFQLAIQADPLYYKAHFKLGYAYYHKGLYDLEIAEYKKCLSLRNDYLPAQLNLGHAYLARDQLEQAREAYRRVLDQDPNNMVASYNLGLVEFDLREFDRSEKHLETFLRTQTDDNTMTEQAKRCLERIQKKREEKEAKGK